MPWPRSWPRCDVTATPVRRRIWSAISAGNGGCDGPSWRSPVTQQAAALAPAESTMETDSLAEVHPADIAVGHGPDGPMVVAATNGIDVDLLPMAADAREEHAPDADLVVVSSGEAAGLDPCARPTNPVAGRRPSNPLPWRANSACSRGSA